MPLASGFFRFTLRIRTTSACAHPLVWDNIHTMEGKEQFGFNKKETPLTTLYQEHVAREPRVVMSEAAELEQRFIYEAAKHQADSIMKEKQPVLDDDVETIEEDDRTEMIEKAVELIGELESVISEASQEDTKQIAHDLKGSLESLIGKKSEAIH
jgi:hypothetical protein